MSRPAGPPQVWERDAGLPAERTGLAWLRTTLSQAALAGIIIRWIVHGTDSLALVLMAALLPAFAVLAHLSGRARLRVLELASVRASPVPLAATAALVVATAVIGVVTVVVTR
ncbi:hypothetical protein UG55_108727 [Frankia sp. EI5c]|uniref:DUF202 domain-containing protein n=1 Tax=Frankia sp. EI5c TaxID=683316 RepID=UPI0007C3840D|nr:DUF202 domain-containing protein [Frankia sp. EI5c]OAA19673.1 hypothetical protein UG55_108727 [Frankia sp. EI5c]